MTIYAKSWTKEWLLTYFRLALDVDVPILEALSETLNLKPMNPKILKEYFKELCINRGYKKQMGFFANDKIIVTIMTFTRGYRGGAKDAKYASFVLKIESNGGIPQKSVTWRAEGTRKWYIEIPPTVHGPIMIDDVDYRTWLNSLRNRLA